VTLPDDARGTGFEAPELSPGFVLWRATLAWQRRVTAALAPLGLTHVQFVLLACAWWLGRETAPRQADIAAQAGTDAVMTSEVIRRLEAKGLLRRAADTVDRRARRIALTRDGLAVAERAVAAVEAVDREVLGELDGRTLAGLARIAGLDAAVDAR
jgi:DNA-binding MarR family transcriptional regulator